MNRTTGPTLTVEMTPRQAAFVYAAAWDFPTVVDERREQVNLYQPNLSLAMSRLSIDGGYETELNDLAHTVLDWLKTLPGPLRIGGHLVTDICAEEAQVGCTAVTRVEVELLLERMKQAGS